MKSCRITRKTLTPVAADRHRPDVKRRRERWKRHHGKAKPRKLVLFDETSIKISMAPEGG